MVQMETAATWTLFPFFFTAFLASTRRLCKAISKFSLCPTCPITPCPFQLEPLRSTCRCSSQSLQTDLPLTSKCPLPPSLPYSCSFPLLDVLKLQLKLVPLPSTSEDSTWPTETRDTFGFTLCRHHCSTESALAVGKSCAFLLFHLHPPPPSFPPEECHNHNITCVPQFHKHNSTGVFAPPQRRLLTRSQDFSKLQVDDPLFEGIFDFVNYLPA